jgi:hypothetical protein
MKEAKKAAAAEKKKANARGGSSVMEAPLMPFPARGRSRASQRSADKRAQNQQLEGATVQVVDSSGRSMRGTIRTRG